MAKKAEGTAYHEAGHAVSCYHLHIKFSYLTIIPETDFLGALHHGKNHYKDFDPECDNSLRTADRIEREVIAKLAGQVAEDKFSKRKNWKGSGQDWNSAVNLASYSAGGGEVLQTYVNYLWARSKALFDLPWLWAAVEAVAKELLIRKKMGSRLTRKIIQKAMDDYRNKVYSESR